MVNLKVNIAGVEFKTPIITASGTFGFGREYAKFYDLSILGGICTKGLTLRPRQGNESPRIAEATSGIINSVGLQNPGVDEFLRVENPYIKTLDTVVIANIAGDTVEDYIAVTEKINESDVKMVELNISCPNVKQGGMVFGVLPTSVEHITAAVKKRCVKPLIVKLSPNVASIADNARAAENGGADAISLINTLSAMEINWRTRRCVLANGRGGLSGPAIKPIALRMVREAYRAVKIPIIGMGGATSGEDVLEFMVAGAVAVQIGTINLYDPNAGKRVTNELTKMLENSNIKGVAELVGTLID
ncbi:MAG: dihydroorotate dehydrogenase [Firmicutes bacterium]|nr:dihydroorotate dehydrogenase [Bacillota bacterium]